MTFAPGCYRWLHVPVQRGFLLALARNLYAKPNLTPELRQTLRAMQRGLKTGATPTPFADTMLVSNAYYHPYMQLTMDELRQIEYPWRWADAGGGDPREPPSDLRLAFEALLDIECYEEAYALVEGQHEQRVRPDV